MKRREFLTVPVKSLGGLLLYTIAGEPVRLPAQENGKVRIPLLYFTAAEAHAVSAACARIFPSDESGPGATEANVIVYIDRQLAGPWGRDKYRYTKGPWVESIAEHGYQGKENPQQIYRAGIPKLGEDFAGAPAAEQDKRLRAIEKTTFFRLLRTHTLEGMFSDPLHGGNAGLIGWQLIGYPGPLMSYRDEIDKYHGMPFTAKPKSLEQVTGRPVRIRYWQILPLRSF
jgi:gluconate 2-dehydrogenase gamma chain